MFYSILQEFYNDFSLFLPFIKFPAKAQINYSANAPYLLLSFYKSFIFDEKHSNAYNCPIHPNR